MRRLLRTEHGRNVDSAGRRWNAGTGKDSFTIWIVFNWKEHTDSPAESPASCTLSPQKDLGEQNHP